MPHSTPSYSQTDCMNEQAQNTARDNNVICKSFFAQVGKNETNCVKATGYK